MKKGTLIGGKYEVMEKLGKGGAGCVYRVRDVRLERIWAAKRVKAGGPGMEEKILGRLDRKLFPGIVDVVEEEGFRYLVMDWIDGETLARKLERKGKFSAEETVRIGVAVCNALAALHEMQPRLLYLDCKPSNIMIDREGKIRLIDFGSAMECEEPEAEPIAASPGYAAPEQLTGGGRKRRADVRSDVFGLGRTLYALLGGPNPACPPYGACRLDRCSAEVPKKLAEIVERCTRANPELRFQTVRALQNALEEFEEEEKISRRGRALGNLGTGLLLALTVWRARIFYGLAMRTQREEALCALAWMMALACLTVCWRRFAAEKFRVGRLSCEPLYNMVRTQKKPGRWAAALLAGGLAGLLAVSAAPGNLRACRAAEPSAASCGEGFGALPAASPVVLRDGQLRKLLVRDGQALAVRDPVYMEINPALLEREEELEFTVIARGGSGREYRYALRCCPLPEEAICVSDTASPSAP